MLQIRSQLDDATGEVLVLVHDVREDAHGGPDHAVGLAEIRLAADATFEDFARDIANTVVARVLVRGIAGRNAEDPEVSA